jgi:hypothetical protein
MRVAGASAQPGPSAEWTAADPAYPAAIRGGDDQSLLAESPPLLEQARNLAAAAAAAFASGFQRAAPEEQARRLAICGGCEHFEAEAVRCKKCGCNLSLKARLSGWHCPIDLW